jgi:hypothetical protein
MTRLEGVEEQSSLLEAGPGCFLGPRFCGVFGPPAGLAVGRTWAENGVRRMLFAECATAAPWGTGTKRSALDGLKPVLNRLESLGSAIPLHEPLPSPLSSRLKRSEGRDLQFCGPLLETLASDFCTGKRPRVPHISLSRLSLPKYQSRLTTKFTGALPDSVQRRNSPPYDNRRCGPSIQGQAIQDIPRTA